MYQAHMEQNSRMAATEVTVISRLVRNALMKPLEPMASAKFARPAKVSAVGSSKTVLVEMALSTLRECLFSRLL